MIQSRTRINELAKTPQYWTRGGRTEPGADDEGTIGLGLGRRGCIDGDTRGAAQASASSTRAEYGVD